jgi:lipopolysaccharide export system protein LptA
MPSLRPRARVLLLAPLCGTALAYAARSTPPRPAALARTAAHPAPAAERLALGLGSYTFDAASSEVDYKSHTGSFKQITISQGKITVRADGATATGLGRPSGEWTLTGNVRVHAPPRGSLTSDQAVVQVAGNRIARVTVTGDPAQFTQQSPTTGRITQGHADQIVYDVGAGTVQLSQNAYVAIGRDQFSSPTVLYNINTERIEATSQGTGERVHITIAPRSAPGKGPAAPPKTPASPPPPGRSS